MRNAMVVHDGIAWGKFFDVVILVLRPLAITLGIAAAAVSLPAPAHADVTGDAGGTVLNGIGIGNNGATSTAIAGVGQSICPMLVQPGSTLASMATQVSGNGGLAPTIAGWVATMVIQTQCPGWMTSLSNGQMPAGLDTLTNMASPALGLPSAAPGSALPFGIGAAPATPAPPFALPGTSPIPSTGLTIPGR
ncbi:MAG: hypothetical protein ABW137_01365 [Mycobacterium sp.]